MSSELLNALESRVSTAVDTIGDLRSEIKVLKEERQLLENKLRELLTKIERSDGFEADTASPPEAPAEIAPNGMMLPEAQSQSFSAPEPSMTPTETEISPGFSSESTPDNTFSRSSMGYGDMNGPKDDSDY